MTEDRPEYRNKPVSEILAAITDRSISEFRLNDDYEYPSPDELESLPEEEQ